MHLALVIAGVLVEPVTTVSSVRLNFFQCCFEGYQTLNRRPSMSQSPFSINTQIIEDVEKPKQFLLTYQREIFTQYSLVIVV